MTDKPKLEIEILSILEKNEELYGACLQAAQRLVPATKLLPSHVSVADNLYGSTLRLYYEAKVNAGKP